MRAAIVGPKSRLTGVKCGLCPGKIRAGDSVLHRHMPNSSYAEDRLVFHTGCMAALVDRAPAGRPVTSSPKAQAVAIRAAVEATGDPYARQVVDADAA